MKIFIFLLTSTILFLVLSCKQEVKLDASLVEIKLVVQCFISPQDTVINVLVSQTSPIVGTVNGNNIKITNALVTLSNGETTLNIPFVKEYYQLPITSAFRIEFGKVYTLKVTTPNGQSVEATCEVPNMNITERDLIVTVTSADKYDKKQLLLLWNDISGQPNYYGVWTAVDKLNPKCSVGATSYISDLGKDGSQLSSATYFNTSCNLGSPKLKIYFGVYDDNFNKFYKTLNEQKQTQGVPFTENVQITTNVRGGYGVFAAYYVITKVINY